MRPNKPLLIFLTLLLLMNGEPACAGPREKLDEAIKEYNAGHTDRAAELFTELVKENQNNGEAHYYLSRALKKMGQSDTAVFELELAAKLCPPEAMKALAKQLMESDDLSTMASTQSGSATGAGSSPFANMGAQIRQFFGGPKAPAGAQTVSLASWVPKDLLGPVRELLRKSKKWMKDRAKQLVSGAKRLLGIKVKKPKPGKAPFHDSESSIISQRKMLSLIAQANGHPEWMSHEGGVAVYHQAIEHDVAWTRWIWNFKRTFKLVLLRHLYREAKHEIAGKASIVLSLDRDHNLRGCIFESTASDGLNKCLVETVRDLDGHQFLAFPQTSRVTGWNFNMTYDFGPMLNFIKAVRAQQEARVVLAQGANKTPSAKHRNARSERILARTLERISSTGVKIARAEISAKATVANVHGVVLKKPKPVELKGESVKLADIMSGKTALPTLADEDGVTAEEITGADPLGARLPASSESTNSQAALSGDWNVEEFEIDGKDRPSFSSDRSRWSQMSFEPSGTAIIRLANETRLDYLFAIDSSRHAIIFTRKDDHSWQSRLNYQDSQPGLLLLAGRFDGRAVVVKLRRRQTGVSTPSP